MNKIILFFTFSLVLITSKAQNADSVIIKKIADEILSHATAYDNLRFLCKKIGPRLTGSLQAQKAVEATAKMLKEAGADTVYLQSCMVPHWVRGKQESGFIQLPDGKKQALHLCALGNSIGTGKKGISASVVEINSFAQLDLLEKKIKNKIVFFNFPMNPIYVNTFQGYSESGKSRSRGPAKAAQYGAIGAVVRSLAVDDNDFPHTDVTAYNDSFPKIPAVAISTNDANELSNYLRQNKDVKISFTTYSEMLPDVVSYNVIGEIRGTELPEEIITVGGHLDSWDLAEGAHDDGAGCVQSIEVIRTLKKLSIHPKRTIRAVMFMNEESLGRGADKYLELAKANKEQHLFALESDEGGFTPRGFNLDMADKQRNKIKQWRSLFLPYGVYDFEGEGNGSDIEPLKELGVALAGFKPDSQRYFDIHHTSIDVFENVSKRELHLGAVNITALIYLVDKYGL